MKQGSNFIQPMKTSSFLLVLTIFSFVLIFQVEGLSQSAAVADKPPVNDSGNEEDRNQKTGASGIKELGDSDNKPVIDEAKKQLEAMTSTTGELGEFSIKSRIKGKFVVDITLTGKGKVLTVFMVSSNVEVKDQNALKGKLSELQFSNIKIPKNERVKFRYTLTL